MLYLFGRLALSDSFYFNQDLHSDEQPEPLAAHRAPEAANRTPRPTTPSTQPRRAGFQPLASPPAAESVS
jgi:hypothetical protein